MSFPSLHIAMTNETVGQVDGPSNNGVAQLHMVKPRGRSEYEYKYLFVDVKGHERVYLENAESSAAAKGRKQLSLFGVKWG
jgi:import inner membrane translocase subunit TIM21